MPKAMLPFAAGLAVGAFSISLLGFASEWVTTTSARDLQVKSAFVDAQAAVCASLAEAHLKSTKSAVNLEGYQSDARKARDELAREFAVALPGEKTADSIVVSACAHLLNKPKV